MRVGDDDNRDRFPGPPESKHLIIGGFAEKILAILHHHPVETCIEEECWLCAIILCPENSDAHLWKDGCVSCADKAKRKGA